MEDILIYIRWVHLISATSWYGEVVVINFILIPVASRLEGTLRSVYITTLFPRIFRLASVLSLTAVSTGLVLLYFRVNGNFLILLDSLAGRALAIGATLGILLTLFHFFMENRMAEKIGIVIRSGKPATNTNADHNAAGGTHLEDIHTRLKIVPRIGLLVITTIFICMMIGVRGL